MSTEGWIAVASVVNAFTVVLLAAITFWYAKSAKRQAEAARQQASAAQQQATAASATLATLRQQMEDTAEIGKTVMVASIDSTLRRIEEWDRQENWRPQPTRVPCLTALHGSPRTKCT